MSSPAPWLTIVGLGEDGADGLSAASLKALKQARVVMGAKRHLGLLPDLDAKQVEWPIPFADGLPLLESYRGQDTVVLASGDPFWHGAGGSILRLLDQDEWLALPAVSSLSLAASTLGWPLEKTPCLGLHAAPFGRLRQHLAMGQRVFCTVRDGAAVKDLGSWLDGAGFGETDIHILEALGGPRERIRKVAASDVPSDIQHPVLIGLDVKGDGAVVPLASGRPDHFFANDGQITKRPVRALTLSALAPKHGEHLWDIGGGSGSISIEWLLAHPSLTASAVEVDETRAARISENAEAFGLPLTVVKGAAPDACHKLPKPDAVFIGGGIHAEMLEWLWAHLATGTRLVANGVTLEAEILLAQWHADKGGTLMRFDISESKPLGSKRGWKASFPIVQWSVTL